MNAKLTIMQTTDWTKFTFEGWCRQLGAWINGDTEKMVRVVKTMPTKRITQKQREKLLAMYMNDEKLIDRLCTKKTGTCCQLNENEARAIQRLFMDLQLIDDEILQDWISTIWSHHVLGNSLREIAPACGTSVNQIRQDLKCGFAFIKSRYPHFSFEAFMKVSEENEGEEKEMIKTA
ncbi:hypothetical protein LF296_12780 [Acinetobacter vivianii]|uniref:Phage antitermination protein Q n=1 Tax=Acinetobacter vivianii TaxID=1776742 RepID=A0AAJ6P4A0_9GAMM|nr:hypothetical protein [Acinetobacter vivianii]WDZ50195.1 hypothetical protein LF296_12780 [Acinetobacter vivianii]